jgi:hypothetical protein
MHQLAPRAPIATPTFATASGRRIIDAVTDHHRGILPLLRSYRVHFVGRLAIGKHRIEIERRSDRLGGVRTIAGNHDNVRHTGRSQRLDGSWCIAAKLVGKQDGADCLSVNGNKPRRRARTAHSSGLEAP